MKNKFFSEIVISVVLIILLLFLLNPMDFWMPTSVHMMMLVGLAVGFVLFAGLMWRETARDEREQLHKVIAARFSYLIGIASLVTGVIIQSLNHTLDIWLIIALSSMIFGKIAGRIYAELKN